MACHHSVPGGRRAFGLTSPMVPAVWGVASGLFVSCGRGDDAALLLGEGTVRAYGGVTVTSHRPRHRGKGTPTSHLQGRSACGRRCSIGAQTPAGTLRDNPRRATVEVVHAAPGRVSSGIQSSSFWLCAHSEFTHTAPTRSAFSPPHTPSIGGIMGAGRIRTRWQTR